MAEITKFISHDHHTPSGAIALAEVKRGVCQRDVPGVAKAGRLNSDVISYSDPWRARIS